MLVFKSTLSVAVDPPEFPEFITKFEPSIKLPYLHDMHGIYKPASQELTIIRKQEEIIKTVIKDHQINVTVPFTLALKEDIKDYIEYIFFDHERLFKWFAEVAGFPLPNSVLLVGKAQERKLSLSVSGLVKAVALIMTVISTLVSISLKKDYA